jgi:hypothetical protein
MPDGTLRFDILALNARDSVLLAVECSSEFYKADKLAKLVTRANELDKALRAAGGMDDAPHIQPVFVVNKKRGVAAQHLVESARQMNIGLIALEDIEDLLDYLSVGEPHSTVLERFEDCFPRNSGPKSRGVFQELGRYEIW